MARRKSNQPISLVQPPNPAAGVQDLPDEDFAAILRSMMRSKGLTAADLSRAIQKEIPAFSPGNISHYLAGRSMPRSQVLTVLSGVFDVDLHGYNFSHRRFNEAAALSPSGGDPKIEKSELPALSVSDMGDGKALIQVNQIADWTVAIQILQIFQGTNQD